MIYTIRKGKNRQLRMSSSHQHSIRRIFESDTLSEGDSFNGDLDSEDEQHFVDSSTYAFVSTIPLKHTRQTDASKRFPEYLSKLTNFVQSLDKFKKSHTLSIQNSGNASSETNELIELIENKPGLPCNEDAIYDIYDRSPIPAKLAVSPIHQQESISRLSVPLTRHVWKGVEDFAVTTNHKGRQRPAYVSPLLERKLKMEKELGMGYKDPEVERWYRIKECTLKEESTHTSQSKQPNVKTFKVSISDFDKWLQEKKQMALKTNGEIELLEDVQKLETYKTEKFVSQQTEKLARKAYERFGRELLERRESLRDFIEIKTSELAATDIKNSTPDLDILEQVPFEILPAHERLIREALLFDIKTKEKTQVSASPIYIPPKILRKSKQILLNSPTRSRSANDSNTLMSQMSCKHSPESLSFSLNESSNVFGLLEMKASPSRGASSSLSKAYAKESSAFGFSKPRFPVDKNWQASSTNGLNNTQSRTTSSSTKNGTETHCTNSSMTKKSFQYRLTKSIATYNARNKSDEIPGPGHYKLPTDAIVKLEKESDGKNIRSRGRTGCSFGKSHRFPSSTSSPKKTMKDKIASPITTQVIVVSNSDSLHNELHKKEVDSEESVFMRML